MTGSFDPGATRFDLIVSVSTLEHVGLDEQRREPGKAAAAVRRLTSMLAPGGLLWMTVPVGYNPDLEQAIRRRRCARALVEHVGRDRPKALHVAPVVGAREHFADALAAREEEVGLARVVADGEDLLGHHGADVALE